jgi:capping protein alpha
VSDAEKLQIAQHFLLSSPPGEFDEVLSDVRKLLPPSLLTPEMLQGIARAYNNRHVGLVELDGGGGLMVLHKEAELDPTHFIDSVNKKRVKVDHVKVSEEGRDRERPRARKASASPPSSPFPAAT